MSDDGAYLCTKCGLMQPDSYDQGCDACGSDRLAWIDGAKLDAAAMRIAELERDVEFANQVLVEEIDKRDALLKVQNDRVLELEREVVELREALGDASEPTDG